MLLGPLGLASFLALTVFKRSSAHRASLSARFVNFFSVARASGPHFVLMSFYYLAMPLLGSVWTMVMMKSNGQWWMASLNNLLSDLCRSVSCLFTSSKSPLFIYFFMQEENYEEFKNAFKEAQQEMRNATQNEGTWPISSVVHCKQTAFIFLKMSTNSCQNFTM